MSNGRIPSYVIAVIITAVIVLVYILSIGNITETLELPRNSMVIGVDSDNSTDQLAKIDFRLPSYIPEGYCPYDSWGDNITFGIVYAPCNLERPPPTTWITIGISRDVNELATVNKGEYFKEYKARSDRGDKVQLFEINGNPAMGWEMGKKNSITMLDDEVIDVEEVDYPAFIGMYHVKHDVGYGVSAYLPLDELKKILASIDQP
ncbi:MAG: hypothetical protein QXS98_01950 [Candidatus Nitrosocaldus sp.]